MTAPRPRSDLLRLLPGFLISAAAIVLLLFVIDWRKTAEAWSGAQLWVLAPAVLCILAAMLTRAAAWRCLMGNSVPLGRCFWVLNISYLLNGILPFRLGDVARAYLVGREKDGSPPRVSAGAALSAVALERMFDLAFTCVLVLCMFPLIAGMEFGGRIFLAAFGLTAVFFVGLVFIGAYRMRILEIVGALAKRFPFIRPVSDMAGHFLDGLAQVRNLRRSVPAFLWIVVTMLLWAAEYWVVLRGFFPDASVLWGLLSLVGGLIGVALPSAPSSLGVFEGSVTVVLTMGGLAQATAIAYAIAIHLLNILALSTLGVLGLIVEGRSLGSILAAAKSGGKEIT
jgi:glycosyltransferase 2 family protein